MAVSNDLYRTVGELEATVKELSRRLDNVENGFDDFDDVALGDAEEGEKKTKAQEAREIIKEIHDAVSTYGPMLKQAMPAITAAADNFKAKAIPAPNGEDQEQNGISGERSTST